MGTAPSGRSDELQRLENVLRDTAASPRTRGWLLRRAAAGSAAIGLVGLAAACGGSSDGSSVAGSSMPATTNDMAADTIASVINTAITAEALAVTYLTAVIGSAKGTPVEPLVDVLKAANA